MTLQQHYITTSAPLATLNPLSLSNPHTGENILIAHLVFKCLVKVTVWLWPRITRNARDFGKFSPWVRRHFTRMPNILILIPTSQFQTLFQNSAIQAQSLCELRTQLVAALLSGAIPTPTGDAARVTELSIRTLTRHVVLFAKFFRRLQQLDAAQFVLLPTSSELILWYWNKVVEATGGPTTNIQGLTMMTYQYHRH